MRWKLVAISASLLATACSDNGAEPGSLQASSDAARTVLERTIATRVANCIKNGSTRPNCECRANAAARILPFEDFAEETRLLQSSDQAGLDAFQRRMFAEQRDTMFRLSQALEACPAMVIEAE